MGGIAGKAKDEASVEKALARLHEIVEQVRKKDIDIGESLDLLEEGIELANLCTEHIEHGAWPEELDVADATPKPDAPQTDASPEPGA